MRNILQNLSTARLAAVVALVLVAISLPLFAHGQEEGGGDVPIFTCNLGNVGLASQCGPQENPADASKNLPKSTTSCTYRPSADGNDGFTGVKACTTSFEGGTQQTCNQNVNGSGFKGPWRCTGTDPRTNEEYETESETALTGITNALRDTVGGIGKEVLEEVIAFFLRLVSWILGIVGVFFNWVVIRTVFQFGTYFGTSDGMLVAWGIMRDIANIGLLFGFIFMGVLLILNVDGGGHGHGGGMSAKKAIPRLIIFAVLLNFSLFASQAIIDVSNAFSAQFADLAGMSCDKASETNACSNIGISGKVLQVAGMSSIWTLPTQPDLVVLVGLSIFVLITAVVLLAAAIMLIIRVVILSILMITSPIGFAGMAVPGLQGIAKKWWSTLLSQSFFAPAMLLLIFISLKLGEALNPSGKGVASAFEAGNSSNAGNIEVLVVFAVVIGMMIASIMVASKIGAVGASFATNTASAVVFGGTARALNLGVGGGARGLRAIQERYNVGGRVGQAVVNRALLPLEKTNLDVRRTPGMGSLLKVAGIDAGAKPAEHATYGDTAHKITDMTSGKQSRELQQAYDKRVGEQNLEREAHGLAAGAALTPESERFLAGLSVKELEQLHGIQEGVRGLAANLSPEQFEGLMKSDKLSDQQRDQLRNSRFTELREQFATASGGGPAAAAARENVRRWSAKDLGEMAKSTQHGDMLADAPFMEMISDDQFDAVVKDSRLTRAQQVTARAAREERFNTAAGATRALGGMSAENVGKLRGSIVARAHVHGSMSGAQLAAIDPSKIDPGEVATLVTYIRSLPPGNPTRDEFDDVTTANPKALERWGGFI